MKIVQNREGRDSIMTKTISAAGVDHSVGQQLRRLAFPWNVILGRRLLTISALTATLFALDFPFTLHAVGFQGGKLTAQEQRNQLNHLKKLRGEVKDAEKKVAESRQGSRGWRNNKKNVNGKLKKLFVALVNTLTWQSEDEAYAVLREALPIEGRIKELSDEGFNKRERDFPKAQRRYRDKIDSRVNALTEEAGRKAKAKEYKQALKLFDRAKPLTPQRFQENQPLEIEYGKVLKALEKARRISKEWNNLCSRKRYLEAMDALAALDAGYPEFSPSMERPTGGQSCRASVRRAFETCRNYLVEAEKAMKSDDGVQARTRLERAMEDRACRGLRSIPPGSAFAKALKEARILKDGGVDETLRSMLGAAHDLAALQACREGSWRGVLDAAANAAKARHSSPRIRCLEAAADFFLKKKKAEDDYEAAASAQDFQVATESAAAALTAAETAESRCRDTNLFGASDLQSALCYSAALADEVAELKGIVERNQQFDAHISRADRYFRQPRCDLAVGKYQAARTVDRDRFRRQDGLSQNLNHCRQSQSIAKRFETGLEELLDYRVNDAIASFKGLREKSESHSRHAQALLGSAYKLAEFLGEELEDPSEDAAEEARKHFLAVLNEQIDYQLPVRLIPTRVLKSFEDLRAKLKLQAEGAPQ